MIYLIAATIRRVYSQESIKITIRAKVRRLERVIMRTQQFGRLAHQLSLLPAAI
jgi:hypothetical protein